MFICSWIANILKSSNMPRTSLRELCFVVNNTSNAPCLRKVVRYSCSPRSVTMHYTEKLKIQHTSLCVTSFLPLMNNITVSLRDAIRHPPCPIVYLSLSLLISPSHKAPTPPNANGGPRPASQPVSQSASQSVCPHNPTKQANKGRPDQQR
jgi:hypothetical protein